MAYTVNLSVNSEKYLKQFEGRLAVLDKAILVPMRKVGKEAEKEIKANIESQSGRLKSQMGFKVTKEKGKRGHLYTLMLGQLKKTSGGFVPYARIWDKGGTIRPRKDNPYGAKKLAIPMRTSLAVKKGIWRSPKSTRGKVFARDVIKSPKKYGLRGTWATKRAIIGIVSSKYHQTIFARVKYVKIEGDGYITNVAKSQSARLRKDVASSIKKWAKK